MTDRWGLIVLRRVADFVPIAIAMEVGALRLPLGRMGSIGCAGSGRERKRVGFGNKPRPQHRFLLGCSMRQVGETKTGGGSSGSMEKEEEKRDSSIRIRRRSPGGSPVHYVGPFQFRIEAHDAAPRNILEQIVWDKDAQVTLMKERLPLALLHRSLQAAPPVRDFLAALNRAHTATATATAMPALIAELKKASPSKGLLRPNFDPVAIAQSYQQHGAACLSVLTDEKYFQGSFDNLHAIRTAGIQCPLLCKDFIIDAWQIYYARSKGADAILLIAAVLPDADIKYMIKICNILGLAALVEVHDEREMDRVLAIDGVNLIGINNRNLETFEVDISNTRRLLEGERGRIITEREILVVAESGLFTPEDIAFVQSSGVKAVLVGESLIKQEDPGKAIAGLFGKEIASCH